MRKKQSHFFFVFFSVLGCFLSAQSQEAPLNALARFLPAQTCFLISVIHPQQLEKQFLQTHLGKVLQDQDFNLFLRSWFSRFAQPATSSPYLFLEQCLVFRNFFDQHLSLVGVLLDAKTPKQTFAGVLLGKTSRIQELEYFVKNPHSGWGEELTASIRCHPEGAVPFYELALQKGSFFFLFLDSYFLGSFSLIALQEFANNIQHPPTDSLFQESSFQKILQEHVPPPDFFGYLNFENFFEYCFPQPTPKTQDLLRFLGAYSLKNLSLSLCWRQERWQDRWNLQLKDRIWGFPSILRQGVNSFSSVALCPPNTLFFLSLKCSPARVVRLILEGLDRFHRPENLSSWEQLQKTLIFTTLEQSLGALGNELSAFLAFPNHGFLPDVALIAPLQESAPFLTQLVLLLQKQETFTLSQETYLDAPIYILSPKEASGWIWAWTTTQQHLVFSYSLLTLKKILKASRLTPSSLATTPFWKQELEKIVLSEAHQGLFWVHSQQLFRQSYETLEQFLSVFPTLVPFNAYLLPDTDKLANALHFSATFLDYQNFQLSGSSRGDIHSSQGWYFVIWKMVSWIWASSFYQNLPTPEANEKAILVLLKQLAESQKQFQYANKNDLDHDGVGEYGWLQNLVQHHFLPAWLGFQARQHHGIVLDSGYCFKLYLPSEQGPALHEPEFFEWSTHEKSVQYADAQELRWLAYAWPLVPAKTGTRCFAINQNGTIFVSEDAPYQGWYFFPAPEACFQQDSSFYEQARNLEGTFPSTTTPVKTYDGFSWSKLHSDE